MENFTIEKSSQRVKTKKYLIVAIVAAFVFLSVLALCFMPKKTAHAASEITEDVTWQDTDYVIHNNVNDETTREGLKLEVVKSSMGTVKGYRVTLSLTSPFELPDGYELQSITLGGKVAWSRETSAQTEGNITYEGTSLFGLDDFRVKNQIIYNYELNVTEVPLPEEPVKEGHTFAGWYYGTEEEHDENCTAYNGEPIYADTNLHAHFNINVYTVTYDAAGGTLVESAKVNWNTAAPTPETTCTGYDFVGWFKLNGEEYKGEAITEDTVLRAHWQIKKFTVTFLVDGEEYKSVTVNYGTTLGEAMARANVVSYRAMDKSYARVSKNSVITEDADVLVTKLSGMEKFGDYIGSHEWVVAVFVIVLVALAITSAVSITIAVKRR